MTSFSSTTAPQARKPMIDESPTPHQLECHPELAALYALELCARLAMRVLIASAPRPDPQRRDWVEHVDDAALLAEEIKDVVELLIIDIIKYRDCILRRRK